MFWLNRFTVSCGRDRAGAVCLVPIDWCALWGRNMRAAPSIAIIVVYLNYKDHFSLFSVLMAEGGCMWNPLPVVAGEISEYT